MYCFACHCIDCQKQSGSTCGLFATIEADRVKSIGQTPPRVTTIARASGQSKQVSACPKCTTIVWDASGTFSSAVISIKIGTLDMPSLMEPDMHMYIENKLTWLQLPNDAKTCKGMFKESEVWPKSSLARLEACEAKLKAEQKEAAEKVAAEKGTGEDDPTQEDSESQADKTPTAETPEEQDLEERDADKEFERRQKALEERLEKLTLKISEQERT